MVTSLKEQEDNVKTVKEKREGPGGERTKTGWGDDLRIWIVMSALTSTRGRNHMRDLEYLRVDMITVSREIVRGLRGVGGGDVSQ